MDVTPREGAPVLPLLASRQLSLELSKRLKGHGSAGASADGKQGEQLRQGSGGSQHRSGSRHRSC